MTIEDFLKMSVGELLRLAENGAAAPTPAPAEENLLTAPEVATRLKMSLDWVRRHTNELPFAQRFGRRVRFSESGLRAYMRREEARQARRTHLQKGELDEG
jgi:excisionase family DNA binding protein